MPDEVIAIACAIFSASTLSPPTASRIALPDRSYQKRPGAPSKVKSATFFRKAASFCGEFKPGGAPTYLPVVASLLILA